MPAYDVRVETAVLVPIKAFAAAKRRLEGALSTDQRDRLARWTAERVLVAAGELPTYVVCDDETVALWAAARGATVLREVGRGLNAAVDHAVRCITEAGHRHVVVVHGDLPRPAPLGRFSSPATITLVPDRHDDGTNLMSFPLDTPIAAAYGPGSFRRHLAEAMATGTTTTVIHDPLMALDLDHPHDLRHPLVKEVLPEWLRTNPVNQQSPR